MFLVKNSLPLRPKVLLEAESVLSALGPAAFRHSHEQASEKKCFKYRPSKKATALTCNPVKVPVPRFYRKLDQCKTDYQLSLVHPKHLGVYPRCDIPYKPEPHCTDPCDFAERIDDTMYRPSASLDRKFERYWVECNVRKPKRCCRRVPPERSVRVETRKCGVPKRKPCYMVNPMPCKQEAKQGPCPKIQLCDCKPLASPEVNCRTPPRPKSRCRRRLCMYPSFSECQHDDLEEGRPVECRCLEVPPICIVYRMQNLKRRGPCDRIEKSTDTC